MRSNHRDRLLYQVARNTLSAHSFADVALAALDGLKALVPSWRHSIGLIDQPGERYTIYEAVGGGQDTSAPDRTVPLKRFGGDLAALRRGEPNVVQDIHHPQAAPGAAGELVGAQLRGQLLAPILHGGELLGTVNVGADVPDHFCAADIATAVELANIIAAALAREQLRQDLVHAYDRARQANEAKSDFLARMSHEIRTPLTAIIGYIELIGELPNDAPLLEVRDDLTRVIGSSHHLMLLINDILDLAKVEAGRMKIALKPVALGTLIDEVGSVMAPLLAKGDNTWHAQCEPDLHVQGDSTRLRQVLLNLLANAARFTHDGEVSVCCEAHDETVTLRVIDTGEGIPAARLDTLFEPFMQAHTRRGGTGLGLAIAQRYLKLMDATITVQSEVGKGSTFTVMIARSRG